MVPNRSKQPIWIHFKPYWAIRIHISVPKAPLNFLEIGDATTLVRPAGDRHDIAMAPPWHRHGTTEMSVQRCPRRAADVGDVGDVFFGRWKYHGQCDSLGLWDPEKVKQKSMLDMRLCLWRFDSTWHIWVLGMVPVWLKKGFRKNYQICLYFMGLIVSNFIPYPCGMSNMFSLQSLFSAAG